MFIDIHVHTAEKRGPVRYGTDESYAWPELLVEMYDEVGIDKAVLLPEVNPETSHRLAPTEDAGVTRALRSPDTPHSTGSRQPATPSTTRGKT